MTIIILDLLTVAALIFGLFFMFIGALGLWRLPDLFNRMHAASKPITLGISGMLLAAAFHMGTVEGASLLGVGTRAVLVIVFQFVAAPVAAHMISKAAHMDRAAVWEGTLSDELRDDGHGQPAREPGGG
jgi:multicomponent Na+:H+ antiporter subunit G